MAKVTRNGYLVPAHEALPPNKDDDRDRPVEKYLALSLDWGFIRYLQAVDTPEVAIFTRVHVRKPNETVDPPGFIFQNVYMAGDGSDALASIGKGTSVPRMDISIMPPLKYTDETIIVEIRAVELDGEDTERTKGLINLAASVAAVSEPANTAAISTFQTVLNFVADANRDDIEFSFDFQLSKQAEKAAFKDATGKKRFEHLPPRVASYVVIKTEDPRRINLPDTYLGVAGEGVLWTVSNLFQAATLNILNWDLPFVPSRVGNPYRRILGNPFAVATSSMVLPNWRTDGVLGANVDYAGKGNIGFLEWGQKDTDYAPFVVTNKSLRLVGPEDFRGVGMACSTAPPNIFRDQTYFYISVAERANGVSYDELKLIADARKAVDNLGINTEGRSIDEVLAGLESVKVSATATLMEQSLDDVERKLKEAKTTAEKNQIVAQHKKKVEELKAKGFLSEDAATESNDKVDAINYSLATLTVKPRHFALKQVEGALTLAPKMIFENLNGLEIEGAFLLAQGGATQLTQARLERSRASDPSQVVEFNLEGIDAVPEGKYDFIVQTPKGNITVDTVTLWEQPTIASVTSDGDGLTLRGARLSLANAAKVKAGDTELEVTLEQDEAAGTTVLKLPANAAIGQASLSIRLDFPDKRPAAELELTGDLSLSNVDYGQEPIQFVAGVATEARPRAVMAPAAAGPIYAVAPDLPIGVTLDPVTGVLGFDATDTPAESRAYTITYTAQGVALIGSVTLSIESAPTAPDPASAAGEGDDQ